MDLRGTQRGGLLTPRLIVGLAIASSASSGDGPAEPGDRDQVLRWWPAVIVAVGG
jgi:hypothetical protein